MVTKECGGWHSTEDYRLRYLNTARRTAPRYQIIKNLLQDFAIDCGRGLYQIPGAPEGMHM